jgi:hypothetical protein
VTGDNGSLTHGTFSERVPRSFIFLAGWKSLLGWTTNANLPAENSKEGNTNLSFTEASISKEPNAVVPHAGICAGAVG